MKKIITVILKIITTVVITTVIIFTTYIYIFSGGKMWMPKDQSMITTFYKHQTSFDNILKNSNYDVEIAKIIKDPRFYMRDDDSLYITAYTFGLVTGGEEKGYAYLKSTPKNLVDSIDIAKSGAKSNEPIYRYITGNWYLYYSWDN